MKRNSQ